MSVSCSPSGTEEKKRREEEKGGEDGLLYLERGDACDGEIELEVAPFDVRSV